MIHSIKRQIAVMTFALLLGTLFLFWGINNIFLERVYNSSKQQSLQNIFHVMNEAKEISDIQTDQFQLKMESFCDNYNMTVMIADPALNVIYPFSNFYDESLRIRLISYVYGDSLDVNNRSTTVLKETDAYRIIRTRDTRLNSDYLEMVGILDSGNFFIVRTALESVRENVELTNRFLAFVAVFISFLSIICIWYISERITRPLNNLIKISSEMSGLNFNVKYIGGGMEEIDALGEHMNELSYKLEETISDLKTANNELKRDIEQKIQIDEMRKDFLSNVSHELKTPISLIQGYAEGLRECINDDPESREFYCDVIMDEAKKMNGMVQKLLTLNQIEFGSDQVTMERFDVTVLVNNILNSMGVLAEQKGVTVSCNTKQPVYVWSDEFKVEEVFTNYMSNALNHVANENRIDVRIKKKDKTVRISVFNTGQPIPEEDIDKIWIRFYKVDKARTREYGGSGIGLSIVKAIMESLNQQYGVKNYDNGVEFWFTLEGE